MRQTILRKSTAVLFFCGSENTKNQCFTFQYLNKYNTSDECLTKYRTQVSFKTDSKIYPSMENMMEHRHYQFPEISPSRLFLLAVPGSPLFGFFIFFLVRGGKPISSMYRSSLTLEVAAWITGVGMAGGAANCWGAI